jgi:hypothetical protein
MEAFMKVTKKRFSNIARTLLTPPDKHHDQQRMNNSKGPRESPHTRFGLGLWSLTPLSAIFQLYRDGQF